MEAEKIKKELMKKTPIHKLTEQDFLSTGSTLLNLCCTGNPFHGFAKGGYYLFAGDSASGKTFACLTCLAEASINPNFDNYRFIYDNSENGAFMNIEHFFGKRVLERMEPPSMDRKSRLPVFSSTVEEFYYHIDDAYREGKPFIYILDSMDSLASEAEIEKFSEQKEAHRKGRTISGSYNVNKAKENSANLRKVISILRKTGSILIIISQTRQNLGFGFKKKTRSGGDSLKFYANIEMWSSIREKIKKTIKGKTKQIGIQCQIQIEKNRFSGKERNCIIPIYHSYGIDDIGSCVDYLIQEGHWKKNKNSIVATEFNMQETRDKLIKRIEKKGAEKELRSLVGQVWNYIEDQCKLNRKKRYD